MKITGIDIGEYRQFKNINFDFTYPPDHAKAGQPLDKVCFIGQSGTGKSTILGVIYELLRLVSSGRQYIRSHNSVMPSEDKPATSIGRSAFKVWSQEAGKQVLNIAGDESVAQIATWVDRAGILNDLEQTNKLCLFIADSIANAAEKILSIDNKIFPQSSDFVKGDQQLDEEALKEEEEVYKVSSSNGIYFGSNTNKAVWQYLLSDILSYDKMSKDIALKLIQNTGNFSTEKLINDLTKWKIANPNPRLQLAEQCINPLLSYFFLEVDIENTDAPIVIKNKSGSNIKSFYLSTGTKQLITTAIPLYKIDTNNTIILFDEPERSLFPDIQRKLVDHYVSLAPTAQFFFATHSPIIASAFEPCERFILYFNEHGEVNYHKGTAPEGDDPNDLLSEDFGLEELMLPKGLEEYERYRQLAMRIREETDDDRKNKLIIERLELGNRYNFAGRYAKGK